MVSNTQKFGRRVTSFNAFVDPILGKRQTLQVIKYARVTQVLFKTGTNQVIGVEYERFGKLLNAKASKEVILSAGAIGSPKILLLSGIGPAQDLNDLEIPLKANLPVGQNLQDHVGAIAGPFTINQPVSILPERDMTPDAAKLWVENGTGPFSLTFARSVALLTSEWAKGSGESNWPDLLLGLASNGISQDMDQIMAKLYNMRPEVMREFLNPVKGKDAFAILLSYSRPKSRGTLRLKSANFHDEPLIDPAYFTDTNQLDLRITVEAMKKIVELSENAPSFQRLGSKLSPVPFPPCKHLPFRSDVYWECYTRQYSVTLHHFCGTVAMGQRGSPNAVVDSDLRVIGVTGLRVMDASVMPTLISTNTNAATMMIAEQGSDLVKRAWHISG